MAAPRFGSVNFVLPDITATTAFLEALGVVLSPPYGDWDVHHRTVAKDAGGVDVDLDSAAFGRHWGGVPEDLVGGAVLNLMVETRAQVDAVHAQALELGADELKAPWDAFWGARYSVVRIPGPLAVGLMSPSEESRQGPVELTDFT